MKKISFLILCFFLSVSIVSAQQQEECREVLFSGDRIIGLEEQVGFPVKFSSEMPQPTRKFLRVVGGGIMPHPFEKRGETLFREMECLIDDCLDSVNVSKGKYALNLYGENENFEKCAFIRVPVANIVSNRFDATVQITTEQLHLCKGGRVDLEFEIYYPKEGRAAQDIYDVADTILVAGIPEGTYTDKTFTFSFQTPKQPASIVLKIVGQKFEGLCRFSSPVLESAGASLGNFDFQPLWCRTDTENYWVGVNLLTKSWPMWSLEYNGKEIFRGRIFDRASDIADFYIPLPSDLDAEGYMELTLHSEKYLTHVPYRLRAVEIIEQTAREVEIADVPEYVAVGTHAGVLIETNRPNTVLHLKDSEYYKWENEDLTFDGCGLHVLRFKALKPGSQVPFEIETDGQKISGAFKQFVLREGPAIYLSSGDEIYIDKDPALYDYFFKWYIHSRVGNWYQFRPSYQWSGFREVDPPVLRNYYELLNSLEMPYAWQVEGRTLAGNAINPSLELLSTPMFQGKQAHENDGGYYYWQHFQDDGFFTDIRARYLPLGGIFAKHRPIYTENGKFVHYDPYAIDNMQQGAEMFVSNLKGSRGESTRHTGPSTLFRYFFQAGYEWVGAEQMYGAEDVILSALRGASKAYGKPVYGSLHAMQWGSGPFTDPAHALRLYQSMALSYMHGTTHINTEEALWLDEYANDRYSVSGKEHLFAQNQLLDYVQTHSRGGQMNNEIAVIQGRNCPWKCFCRTSMWSQKGEKWQFNKINESFDLLNVFYPESVLDCCGPDGWFTKTPYGTVDLLPVEAPEHVLDEYSTLIFLGWNTYDEDDFIRLSRFVKKGGTLLMGAVHANANLQPDETPEFPENDRVLRKMLGKGYRDLQEKTVITYGKGKIIYYPEKCYPSEAQIRQDYKASMISLAQANAVAQSHRGTVIPGDRVDFACWDNGKMRTLLLLNVDWKHPEATGKAKLELGGKEFGLEVRHYNVETVRCAEGLALHPLSNTSDVLSIGRKGKSFRAVVQTTGDDQLEIFNSLNGEKKIINIAGSGIHEIEF